MQEWIQRLLKKVECKLEAEHARIKDQIPYWTTDGKYEIDYAQKDIYWWTNGFWTGILWKLYALTGDGKYRESAESIEKKLDKALYGFNGLHHDVGFMWLHSAVADYRLTGNEEARSRGLLAASVLAGRYHPEGQYIRAWNPECVEPGEDCTGWIIVDSMMNIPLLYWASKEVEDTRFYYVAKRHADTVMRTLVREDGSCGHIAELEPTTGELKRILGGQGYSEKSAWSRGQSWILYGFALSYRYTGDQRYLDTAKKTAHYFMINCSLTGDVPLCDFRQPAEPVIYDASAGACAACGLLEIAEHVPEAEKELYRSYAERIIRALADTCCNWTDEEDGIVQKCCVAYHGQSKNQTDLIYADYFLLEALLRLTGNDILFW